MKSVTVISFFKSDNLGDLELTRELVNQINKKARVKNKIDFLTLDINKQHSIEKKRDKPITRKRYLKLYAKKIIGQKNIQMFRYFLLSKNKRKWSQVEEAFKKSDIVVIGGGNMFMDTNFTWPYLIKKYVDLAGENGKEIQILYTGVGPILNKKTKKIFNYIFEKVDFISVRDKYSLETIKIINNDIEVIQSIDPVFSKEKRVNDLIVGKKKTNLFIGVNIVGEMCFKNIADYKVYIESIKNIIEELLSVDKNKIILFSTDVNDYNSIYKVKSLISPKENKIEIRNIYNYSDIQKLYNTLDYLIGGRMHAMIFAQIEELPFVGFSWQNKINGFALEVENEHKIFGIEQLLEMSNTVVSDIETTNFNIQKKHMRKININLKEKVNKGNIII